MRKFFFCSAFAWLIMVAFSGMGLAQGAGSSLTGTVVDQSGAVLPGADILVRNVNTGAEYKAVTVDNGTFSIPSLSAGTYTATVSMPNFKQSCRCAGRSLTASKRNMTTFLRVISLSIF
jgi:hypothetical protein